MRGSPNTFEIEYFDNEDNLLTFYVTVTDYVNVAPQGKWASSDWDCYGYEEIEWECTAIQACDEDGNVVVLTAEQVKSIISEYSEYIEDKLLDQIRELREDSHECDTPDPEYYDY